MKLPLVIDPCPIVEVTVEIRFETQVPEDAIFGVIYQALKKDFPKASALPMASLPAKVRQSDPNLVQQPLHKLEGDGLIVLVGARSASVGMRGKYPGWAALSERFRTTLARIAGTGIIAKPVRFGLRYINFFQGDVFPKLTFSAAIGEQAVKGEGTFFKTVLSVEKCRLILQIGKDLALVTEPGKTGSVIDIDSFVEAPKVDVGLDAALSAFLENAHLAEKEIFFTLLKPDFLSTLKPTYATD